MDCFSIIALVYMKTNIAIVGDNEHFHNEIDFPGSEGLDGIHENIQLQMTFSSSPSAMPDRRLPFPDLLYSCFERVYFCEI